MSEQFVHTPFTEINLKDNFFDSLKEDYMEFENWFHRKSSEGEKAFIQLVNEKLEGFLYLKEETGPITDVEPSIDCEKAMKIGTFKINPHGTRLGERFIKKSIDFAINNSVNFIYVTIFEHHEYLLKMFLTYGFELHGKKITPNGTENVLVKEINKIHNDVLLDYPRIKTTSNSHLLAIMPEYHTKLFPDSKLYNEKFDVIKDVSHTNSITKIYIARMSSMKNIKPGDNLVIYRTSDGVGPAKYRAVATTVCTVIDAKSKSNFKNLSELKSYCKNYSVFTDKELSTFVNGNSNYYVLKMTYNVSLNKRIIRDLLINQIGLDKSRYWGCFDLTNSEFDNILSLGEVNNNYLI
ncbi:N-acetyltransferase [Clostridium paraputrificum]|uniref:N-acetyltransferase n=1 Tax=Clostridium paraputrificum TaxID=29363 RepID=UPI000DD09C32|nr:N-acetyltransferase [Clostridium paraputrificum]